MGIRILSNILVFVVAVVVVSKVGATTDNDYNLEELNSSKHQSNQEYFFHASISSGDEK